MRKIYIGLIVFLFCILGLVGCESKDVNVAGKVYTYEKEGIGGEFNIYINEDGTFTYYEGINSSYIGMGTWDIDKSVITLTDDDDLGYSIVNRFKIQGDNLIFIKEKSDNFLYVNVKDGEVFFGEPFHAEESLITDILLEQ